MVTKPGFSERLFEFAFNAEFVSCHSSIVETCPSLPSLQEEKRLGYDVEFQLKKRGGGRESIFLQHKVARFVDKRSGSNSHFYDYIGGPYFAFTLDVDQYNLIQRAASRRANRVFYCAPLCITRRDIDSHFLANQVLKNSVWLDVGMCSSISDSKTHTIVYDPNGTTAALFSSDPNPIKTLIASQYEPSKEEYVDGITHREILDLYNDFYEELQQWWPTRRTFRETSESRRDPDTPSIAQTATALPSRTPDDASASKLLEETTRLVSDWYQLTWLITTGHPPLRSSD